MNPKTSTAATYEPPELVPIGNLRDVVAGTTQTLNCDSISHSPGSDGDSNSLPQDCT